MTLVVLDTDIEQLVAEAREAYQAYREADEQARRRRLELGQALVRARARWPMHGPRSKGWTEFLGRVGISIDTARDAMAYAGFVEERYPGGPLPENLPSRTEAGLDSSRADDRDAPPPSDEDVPREADESPPNRDAYCTPLSIARCLPPKKRLCDPCSNARSVVEAAVVYSLELGTNGLVQPWSLLVYANGPFSNLLPFAEKLEAERKNIEGAGFMVNTDHSTRWWKLLVHQGLRLRLDFDDRLEFIPPPGVEPSKNDRPQTLLMDEPFWEACDQRELLKLGSLWVIKRA